MATRIQDRLRESEEGILTLKVTPEEWLELATYSDCTEKFYTNKEERDPAFILEGIVIYTEDGSKLRELQKARATHYLESLLWKKD